ncbi:PilZ domain-containing protein [Hyphomicrobium sp.]|uniref:PilZ domain-containing protein n=1 Tax=Hyphomicrobium sp. TaxID=82 RepID=UPI000FA7F091|nr:PilZ domain-containing protein [Hyphomicrobium sp.]RUO98734.1 MAG: PilZ domain-containing protein [Hyphomicrobium sp.]
MRKAVIKSTKSVIQPPEAVSLLDLDQGHALFEAFVCEFHWTVLQIGAIASSMNASIANRRAWAIRSCSNLIPVESPVIRAALNSATAIGLPKKLAASLQKIFLDLSDAKSQTVPVIRDAGAFTGPEISAAKLEQTAALWRTLAAECETAVQLLEPEARWRLSGLYTGNCLVLGRFLRAAISGAYDCVNQFGEVAIPVLPQRRISTRYALLQPCILHGAAGRSPAFAHDFSKYGINLSSERSFEVKERAVVELRSGRKMRGMIVWARSQQLSLQFDEPLAGADALFVR